MRKDRSVKDKNDFDLLVELLRKSPQATIQIAFREALKDHPYIPKDIMKLLVGENETNAGLIYKFFALMSQVIGNMELAYRRGEDYEKDKKNKEETKNVPKEVPQPYKKVIDKSILDIADSVRKMIPFIEELGDRIEFEVDNMIVIIKQKKHIKEK